jgi:hypothetical protein
VEQTVACNIQAGFAWMGEAGTPDSHFSRYQSKARQDGGLCRRFVYTKDRAKIILPESAGATQILAAAVHWNSGPVNPDFATTKAQQSGQAKQSEPTVIGFALYWTCLVDSGGLRIIRISGSSGWILLSYS